MGWMASPLLRYSARAYTTPTYHGGQSWLQIAPFASFCDVPDNHCDPNTINPTNPDAGHCQLNDYECWWHQPVTWIPSCTTTCVTSAYAYATGSTEPGNPDPDPPTCNLDTSKVPGNAIIVDDETSPPLNVQGCGGENWSSNGIFNYAHGTNSAGDPIGGSIPTRPAPVASTTMRSWRCWVSYDEEVECNGDHREGARSRWLLSWRRPTAPVLSESGLRAMKLEYPWVNMVRSMKLIRGVVIRPGWCTIDDLV
ncbi:hypothetical protein [Amycolatopsis sp. GM8]|uniref:hypothetical protein n=1 Tax=Amycolatopsis sp. GM8 TaxID=2896530 RepID=UPI001F47997F|nr:hypothetical protein [Amycolatopsis sp. GM8]